ncbi:MAG: hypothetical protein ACLRTA_05130 [Clostridia bacterium]
MILYGYLPVGDTSLLSLQVLLTVYRGWSRTKMRRNKACLKDAQDHLGIAVVLELIPTIYKIYNM